MGSLGPGPDLSSQEGHHPETRELTETHVLAVLPSRNPCRRSLYPAARRRQEAAWTAREGWGTPGERCLCRKRGKQTSTLEERRSTPSGTRAQRRPLGNVHVSQETIQTPGKQFLRLLPTKAQGLWS